MTSLMRSTVTALWVAALAACGGGGGGDPPPVQPAAPVALAPDPAGTPGSPAPAVQAPPAPGVAPTPDGSGAQPPGGSGGGAAPSPGAPAPAPAPGSPAPSTPPAAPCAGQALNWQAGGQVCAAAAPFAPSGGLVQLVDTDGPATGAAQFSCQNGLWTPVAASCSGPPAPAASACGSWSDPLTWGGTLPAAQSLVDIPVGRCVTLDTSPPPLAGLVVRGTLTFADTGPRHLQSAWIHVNGGALQVGRPDVPFQHAATITLTDTNTAAQVVTGMGTRGLLVTQGRLLLHGRKPAAAWTRLADHAAAGGAALTLAQPVADWAPGDEVVVAPTDFYGIAGTEQRLVGSTSGGGSILHLTAGLAQPRWGRLQYPDATAPSGLSLAPAGHVPPAAPAPTVLDQRAEVGHLTRSIVIQGPDDALWQVHGFGAHTMVMGAASQVVVDGVRFRRVGQAGLSGRYPFHWHMLSYVAGQPTGDATGHVLRNSVITQSSNRCVTIHGTNGVQLASNICFDIQGHAIFLEDAVERRNVIEDNLVLRVREPARPFLNHDRAGLTGRGGPSGMWLTHPDNTVRRNVVADVQGNGYWLAFPRTAIGHPDSLNPAIRPRHAPFGVFDDNVAHSANLAGIQFDDAPVVAAPHGDIEGLLYQPTANQLPASETNPVVPFTMRRNVTYKNREGLWNRVNGARYEEWVSADNTSKYFIGSSALSVIRRSLVVGTSLNNANTWETLATSAAPAAAAFRAVRAIEPPAAFASYHGGVAMEHNTVVNFPFVASGAFTASGSVPSGAFANDDYYLRPVERSLAQNQGNLLVRSVPGRRSVPSGAHFAFAGAVVDTEGLFGPRDWSWVYDTPFFTAQGGCLQVAPAGSNGATCPGPYVGAEFFVLDRNNEESYPLMALAVTRRDPANPDIVLGSWNIDGVAPAAASTTLLPNMRHVAMHAGGVFNMEFPGYRSAVQTVPNALGPLTDVRLTIGNMHTGTTTLVLAVEFHAPQAHVFATTFPGFASAALTGPLPDPWIAAVPAGSTRRFTAVGSRAALLASAGDTFFHDLAGARVWMKLRGGLVDAYVADPSPFSDETLYRPFYLRITP